MKSTMPPSMGANATSMLQARVSVITRMRSHGTQRTPAQARGAMQQPGPGGALVTWHLPKRYNDVTGYRIYTGTEKNLAMQVGDRGTRQVFVPLPTTSSARTTTPNQNIFVSVINGYREGPRFQIITAPLASTGPMPQPTRDYLNMFSGGLDKTQSGQPSGQKLP